MSVKKAIGGSICAIILLVVSQLVAQLVGSLFIIIKVSEGICNIIAGIIYIGLALILSKILSEKLLKVKVESLGMPRFSLKTRWVLVAVLLLPLSQSDLGLG